MNYLYITNIFNIIVCSCLIEKYLHVFQLKDYNSIRFFRFFKKKSYIFTVFLAFLVVFIINKLFFNNTYFTCLINLSVIFINSIHSINLIKSNKTPLKYTAKIKRLYYISIIIIVLLNSTIYGVLLSLILLPFIVSLANICNLYDRLKNKHYIRQAKKKLSLNTTKVIAITGSNGKTSVKNILLSFLQTKYKTQATPKSYNTELGIAKFINESLDDDCEYLILEYGARRKNDIKKLCNLFGADLGIITCVNPQHMETFKTIDNAYRAKYALSTYLGASMCIYNLDNMHTAKMYNSKAGNKLGISINENTDLYASNIRIEDNITHFNLHYKKSTYSLATKLLGRHNVTNILLSCAMALYLKIDITNLIKTIASLSATPHRLELIKTHINILDDSYNCSSESANEALWVLSQMSGSHMVATPGIIEGGRQQYIINYGLGRKLAHTDSVIIIGSTNSKALSEGLKSTNYQGNIVYSDSLEHAKIHFSKLKKGDTLLLLNDLPDDYD